jgi:hypothetical protein
MEHVGLVEWLHCLPSKPEALSSNPSATKKKKRRRRKEIEQFKTPILIKDVSGGTIFE